MNPRWPLPRRACALRPELAAYFVIRRVDPDRPDRIDKTTLGVLAELARHGRPW